MTVDFRNPANQNCKTVIPYRACKLVIRDNVEHHAEIYPSYDSKLFVPVYSKRIKTTLNSEVIQAAHGLPVTSEIKGTGFVLIYEHCEFVLEGRNLDQLEEILRIYNLTALKRYIAGLHPEPKHTDMVIESIGWTDYTLPKRTYSYADQVLFKIM